MAVVDTPPRAERSGGCDPSWLALMFPIEHVLKVALTLARRMGLSKERGKPVENLRRKASIGGRFLRRLELALDACALLGSFCSDPRMCPDQAHLEKWEGGGERGESAAEHGGELLRRHARVSRWLLPCLGPVWTSWRCFLFFESAGTLHGWEPKREHPWRRRISGSGFSCSDSCWVCFPMVFFSGVGFKSQSCSVSPRSCWNPRGWAK